LTLPATEFIEEPFLQRFQPDELDDLLYHATILLPLIGEEAKEGGSSQEHHLPQVKGKRHAELLGYNGDTLCNLPPFHPA